MYYIKGARGVLRKYRQFAAPAAAPAYALGGGLRQSRRPSPARLRELLSLGQPLVFNFRK